MQERHGYKMKIENYHILHSMLFELQQEYDKVVVEINDNLIKIQEYDLFTNTILQSEDSNYKFFSPRNVESIHKKEINQAREDKLFYIQQNELLSQKKDKLFQQIENINKILIEENGRDQNALHIQEEDRKRIARDLHDTSLQNLAHLVHKIELCSMYIDKDPLQAKLELSVISKNIKDVIEEIRNTIFDLRPMSFDDLGLKAAFERLLSIINENRKYELDIHIENVSCENNITLVSIYRAVQECFINIVKHAEANKIFFHCKLENNIYHIVIADNGKGFSKDYLSGNDDKHFGLALIKERIYLIGGKLSFDTNENGTKIEMFIPVESL